VPRAGLDPATVTAAGAALADEVGLPAVTMGLVAERLGVRTPSLYKHVDSLADLQRRIAVLGLTELGEAVRDALQGLAGSDALTAAAQTIRRFVAACPGRYAATIGVEPFGPEDPLAIAGARLMDSLAAVLRGYPIAPGDQIHALRMLRSLIHGFATLQAANGFQLGTETDESFAWLIAFVDRALLAT
jgi:AcrR family transcriptional regulator